MPILISCSVPPVDAPLPEYCKTGNMLCTDARCQYALLRQHRIVNDAEFDSFRTLHDATLYPPKTVPANDIFTLLSANMDACNGIHILFYDEAGATIDNTNIMFKRDEINADKAISARYYAPLLKAIKDHITIGADTYSFDLYKGNKTRDDGSLCSTIIFKVCNAAGDVKYMGDLSGLYP